jgi:hypothetical protein
MGTLSLPKKKSPWLPLSGVLIYEPNRDKDFEGNETVFRKTFKTKTLIVQLHPSTDLNLYYEWFLKKKYGDRFKLQPPMFGLHVTVVRGDEKILHKSAWKKRNGELISFEYNPERLKSAWQFWSLPVRGTYLEQLRVGLGLSEFHDFHLTVGRVYDWQKKWY